MSPASAKSTTGRTPGHNRVTSTILDELTAQITEEVAAITDFLEQRLSRRSRWNGEVKLTSASDNYGQALWSGSISIDHTVAQTDLRWRTLIHEALHHFSTGLTPTTYFELPGWEEGVVEQLQRVLRDEILLSVGISFALPIFETIENSHKVNKYIEVLEPLRTALREPTPGFYEVLLASPLKNRPASIIDWVSACRPVNITIFNVCSPLHFPD